MFFLFFSFHKVSKTSIIWDIKYSTNDPWIYSKNINVIIELSDFKEIFLNFDCFQILIINSCLVYNSDLQKNMSIHDDYSLFSCQKSLKQHSRLLLMKLNLPATGYPISQFSSIDHNDFFPALKFTHTVNLKCKQLNF